MKNIIFYFLIGFLIYSCKTYESVYPYKNLVGYDSESLFPIRNNNTDFSFRAWINNSTSIDRVITISRDSLYNYKGTIIEIETDYSKKVESYRKNIIKPLIGFKEFEKKLDSLYIIDITDQPYQINPRLHSPFSTYIIEIKNKDKFNTFQFDTNFPLENEKKDFYSRFEKLLFEQFSIKKRFNIK